MVRQAGIEWEEGNTHHVSVLSSPSCMDCIMT